MKNPDDEFYIKRVKAGDISAFSAIVSNYQKMVFTIVLKIVENKEDAEDIMQEIFVKVFKSLDKFKEESEFSTWLYRIAYNTTISELRKRRVSYTSINDNLSAVNEVITDEDEFDLDEIKLQYLDEVLKKLRPDEIFLVTLYYFREQSIDAISKISNLSVANVKVKLHRIRKKIALELNRLLQNENK
jgi:RNA polymerase sigma-70 factor (ECF subfamily)